MTAPQRAEADPRSAARERIALRALASPSVLLAATILLAAILYGRLLARSLWVDESTTFWLARGGPLAALKRTWPLPGHSVLFSVLSSLFCFGGNPFRNQILRIPTVIGIVAACYFLYRLAEEEIGRGAGWIAATLFLFSPMALLFGYQARPYALAMAASAASCWTLVRWAATRERRWLVWYALSSALLLHLHFLFSPVFLAHAVFLLFEGVVRRRTARWRELVLAYAAIAALVAPIVPRFLQTLRESHTLVFNEKPAIQELPDLLLPSSVSVGLLLAGLLVHGLFRERSAAARPLPLPLAAMFVTLWAAGPLIVFAVSSATPVRVFVSRYLSYSGLGLALLLAYVGYRMFGGRAGRLWALLGMAAIAANPLRVVMFGAGNEELKPFLDIIRRESARAGAPPPVLFQSELPESNFADWRAQNPKDSYLYTPFAAYPIPNPLLPLPNRLTEEVKEHVSSLLESGLKDRPEVLLVTHTPSNVAWFAGRFAAAGFRVRVQPANAFYVLVFERSAAAPKD